MDNPNRNPQKKIKPVNAEKQILRQQQIKKIQEENKQQLNKSNLPQALPIDDKYIFGLAKRPNDNEKNEINKETEDNDDNYLNDFNSDNFKSRYCPRPFSDAWDKREFIRTKSGGNFCCYSAGIEHNNLIFVCLHGCGHSALSYSLIAKLIKHKYQIFAFDYRGHGHTTFDEDVNESNDTKENDENKKRMPQFLHNKQFDGNIEYKMSKENLVSDIIDVLRAKYGTDDPPPMVFVGHSLGGALAVHTAQMKDGIPSMVGLVVIDLVEGTALSSLVHMRSIINRRPKSFDSMEAAIKYCCTSGMIRNWRSGQLSVPPMFIKDDQSGKYVWRTKVLETEPFWRDWFINLSELFLKSPCSKMLMLADTNRLDKPLTIGQMQGKYEFCVVGCGVGHTLHEDAPKKVADKLLRFAERNQFIKMWNMNKKFRLKKK